MPFKAFKKRQAYKYLHFNIKTFLRVFMMILEAYSSYDIIL